MGKGLMKRSNECRFCTSRKCHLRIVSADGRYDEVACHRHIRDLEQDADERSPGVLKHHSSSGELRRGVLPDWTGTINDLRAQLVAARARSAPEQVRAWDMSDLACGGH